jgi:putative Mn2+ efflux pump MntP
VTAVLLVAVSVGLDNFAVAAAFGMTGAGGRRRLEVALIFGLFAGLMPLVGLALGARLWLTAAMLSLDSLVVGLALGAYRVPLLIAVGTFAIVGVGMSLLGVETGRRVGAALGEYSGLVGSVALIGVGVALGFGVL